MPEIVASPDFADVELHRFRSDQRYRTDAYLDLVRSYSTTLVMAPEAAAGLLEELRGLIDTEYDGYVVRPLVVTLVLARKAARLD